MGFLLVGNGNTIFVVNTNMKVLPLGWSVNHNTGFNKEKNEGITLFILIKNQLELVGGSSKFKW